MRGVGGADEGLAPAQGAWVGLVLWAAWRSCCNECARLSGCPHTRNHIHNPSLFVLAVLFAFAVSELPTSSLPEAADDGARATSLAIPHGTEDPCNSRDACSGDAAVVCNAAAGGGSAGHDGSSSIDGANGVDVASDGAAEEPRYSERVEEGSIHGGSDSDDGAMEDGEAADLGQEEEYTGGNELEPDLQDGQQLQVAQVEEAGEEVEDVEAGGEEVVGDVVGDEAEEVEEEEAVGDCVDGSDDRGSLAGNEGGDGDQEPAEAAAAWGMEEEAV
jgi:hypothetical protein